MYFNCIVYDNKVQGIRVLENWKSCYFSSQKQKDKQNKKPMQVKALATPVCKKSKQKQTNRVTYEYHLVSGSRDISQLWSTPDNVQLVYLFYENYIFNMDTFIL